MSILNRSIILRIKNLKKIKYIFPISFIIFSLIIYLITKTTSQKVAEPIIENLTLVSTSPNPPIYKSIWTTDPIVFTFGQILNPDTIKYSITQYVRRRILSNYEPSKSFSIISLDGWQEDVEYTVIIEKGLLSLDGKFELKENVTFKFMRELPQPGDPEYPSIGEE